MKNYYAKVAVLTTAPAEREVIATHVEAPHETAAARAVADRIALETYGKDGAAPHIANTSDGWLAAIGAIEPGGVCRGVTIKITLKEIAQ